MQRFPICIGVLSLVASTVVVAQESAPSEITANPSAEPKEISISPEEMPGYGIVNVTVDPTLTEEVVVLRFQEISREETPRYGIVNVTVDPTLTEEVVVLRFQESGASAAPAEADAEAAPPTPSDE